RRGAGRRPARAGAPGRPRRVHVQWRLRRRTAAVPRCTGTMTAQVLGLFPLHTVLVPGALLELRVFEPRYLDLVRECGREGSGFGVCMIIEGEEAGAAATPAAFGTEARIEDFGTDDRGLLTLRVRGHRRFHVQRTRVRDNGLVVGEVEWRDPDPDEELRPEHAMLATLL